MLKKSLLFVGVCLLTLLTVPALAQGIFPDPLGDTSPPWADYTQITYQQQGESLYVAITFAEPVADKGYKHAGNTVFNDYDDDINTGQPGNVGSETNLTFCEWDGDNTWCMRVYGLWDQSLGMFTFNALMPVQISADGKTMSYKHSLVGLGLEDVSLDVNGYWLDGTTSWGDPWNAGDNIDAVQLYSFNPSLVTTHLDSLTGTSSKIYFPSAYKTRASSENITGALDELIPIIQSEIGSISPTKTYVVTYNPFSDYAVFLYTAPPNNFFKTWIPGSGWVDNPDWWSMMEGAVFSTMSELKLGYREFFQTQMATVLPLPNTPDNWFSTRLDSTHSFMWNTVHKQTFKAIIGRAIHNLMTIYVGEEMTHPAAHAVAVAARTKAANAYASFSGDAFDLDPWIMTGMMLDKLGSDLTWVKKLWVALPTTFDLPTDTTAGDPVGQIVKPYLRDHTGMTDPYELRKLWYPHIASVQAAFIDAVTGGDFYGDLKAITNFPTMDSVYTQAKAVFSTLVSVRNEPETVVRQFRVEQNYPNPFNPTTTIAFTIPEKAKVTVKVFDVLGREVATILNENLNAGYYEQPWNASSLTSGVYFYRVEAGKFQMTRKALLIK
jgi:hypothetical protein